MGGRGRFAWGIHDIYILSKTFGEYLRYLMQHIRPGGIFNMPGQSFESNPMKDSGDYIEDADFHKVLLACRNETEVMFLKILWFSGRRISEILGGRLPRKDPAGNPTYIEIDGLCPKDIDFDHGKIHYWIIKKKTPIRKPKDAGVSLLNDLKNYIVKYQVTLNARIIPRSRHWGNDVLENASYKSGVRTFSGRRLHPHAFRHSWNVRASRISGSPEDLVLQKEIMDHSNINITMSYLKFADGRAKKLVDAMDDNHE
jgi:integrase